MYRTVKSRVTQRVAACSCGNRAVPGTCQPLLAWDDHTGECSFHFLTKTWLEILHTDLWQSWNHTHFLSAEKFLIGNGKCNKVLQKAGCNVKLSSVPNAVWEEWECFTVHISHKLGQFARFSKLEVDLYLLSSLLAFWYCGYQESQQTHWIKWVPSQNKHTPRRYALIPY